VADAVLVLLLLLAVGATATLALRAARHWHREQAGLAYELPVDRRGTLLRAGASAAAALLATGLAVPLLHTSAAPPARSVAAQVPRPAPSPPARTPEPAPPPAEVRTLGHPAGGILQVLGDGTRVWLPPRYDSPRAARVAYPVVLAHTAVNDPDLYAAFARQAARGRADYFLLVTPPSCGPDPSAVLAEVSRRYRTLAVRSARAVIGIGPQAPCAVRDALAHPTRYRAGVGISGTYPPLAPPAGPYPALLLAVDRGQAGARASALRLRAALHPAGDQVRLLDGVARRRDLLALVATYLTEKLDGPTSHKGALAGEGSPGGASVHSPAPVHKAAPAHKPAPVRRPAHTLSPVRTPARTPSPARTTVPARKPIPTRTVTPTRKPIPTRTVTPTRKATPTRTAASRRTAIPSRRPKTRP
jgi:hypothetical protein